MLVYYNILNVREDSSIAEIESAYQERLKLLEVNKHLIPAEHEKELRLVKKAYLTLINPEERERYRLRGSSQRGTDYFISSQKPSISHFRSNKYLLEIGDEINVTWKTLGSDNIILVPFGQVGSEGSKLIKIETSADLNFKLKLIASNTLNGSVASGELNLIDKLENDRRFGNKTAGASASHEERSGNWTSTRKYFEDPQNNNISNQLKQENSMLNKLSRFFTKLLKTGK